MQEHHRNALLQVIKAISFVAVFLPTHFPLHVSAVYVCVYRQDSTPARTPESKTTHSTTKHATKKHILTSMPNSHHTKSEHILIHTAGGNGGTHGECTCSRISLTSPTLYHTHQWHHHIRSYVCICSIMYYIPLHTHV